MLIKITEISDIEVKREGKRRWKEIRIDYETADKKDNYKILLDWANADAFAEAQECMPDQFYEVKVKKEGKYWNWMGIQESDATSFSDVDDSPSRRDYQKSKPSGGTDWAAKNKLDADKFEFDKTKQDLIIRQSCIGYAIQAIGPGAKSYAYLELARLFETNVWQGFEVVEPEAEKAPVPAGPVKREAQAEPAPRTRKPAPKSEPSDMDEDIPF